ncbi:unnamed protein product [Trichogramma brassicae]|uniref:Major facilitator superfamily (MFS) profile domain-containing protein n=1 Tax=Trichogramma brassicae TaxID=86971 RepID=A0A6H5IIE9_9HYME|nr:unnamed protein product [Trichogramma brassicae]
MSNGNCNSASDALICDNKRQSVRVDAKDKWGDDAPLILCRVRSKKKRLTEVLLRRGADPNLTDGDTAAPLQIMSLFADYKLYNKSADIRKFWIYNALEAIKVMRLMTKPPGHLSLYHLIQARPEEVTELCVHGLLTNKDYFDFACSRFREIHAEQQEARALDLCEKLSRRFFLGWARDSSFELTRYRLPILCCDMIVRNDMTNKDLYNICQLNGLKEHPDIQKMEVSRAQQAQSKRTQWKQWAACISATLSMVAAGTVYGWTTTMGSRITINGTANVTTGWDNDDSVPFQITEDESSWVVSLTVIGSMIGPFYGAYVAATYGRKLCLLLTSLFYILGWLLVIFAQNVNYLYASRMILGVGVGMSYTANPMYVSEVADVNIRGALSTLIAVNVFTGSLIACSVGPWSSYTVLGICLLAIPVIFVLTFAWFPETPYYLVSKGKHTEAKEAIGFLKGLSDSEELDQELELVRKNIGVVESNDELKFRFADVRLLLTNLNNRRALLIVMGLILGQQLSGNFSTMQYLETMFTEAKIGVAPHIATIIIVSVGLVSGATATMTVEGAGRRLLLILSSFGCGLTLLALAVYLLMNDQGTDVTTFNLLPVFDVIFFQIFYQVGLGTMTNLLIGELFPTNVKGIAGAIITIFDGLLGFVVSKVYMDFKHSGGLYVTYLIFAVSCFVLFVFVYGFVPETKCKTFNEIQDILAELKPFRMTKRPFWSKCGAAAAAATRAGIDKKNGAAAANEV